MGVAGAAMLSSLLFLYRLIKAIVVYFVWKKKGLVIGEIGEETRRVPSGGEIKYIFHFTLNTTPFPTKTTYENVVKAKDNKPSINVGDKVEVFFDPTNITFREKSKLQRSIFGCLAGFIGSLVLLALCVIAYVFLFNNQ